MSHASRQTLALLLGNALLGLLAAQASDALAGGQLRLWTGGLLVAPAALLAGHRAGATAVFLTGLALDAGTPAPFGAHALILLAAHAALFAVRGRLARDTAAVRVVAALLANLGVFAALGLVLAIAGPARPGPGRLLAELLVSQTAVAVAAAWFFALTERLCALFGARPGLPAP
jgi:cell shape-determining protein MreD